MALKNWTANDSFYDGMLNSLLNGHLCLQNLNFYYRNLIIFDLLMFKRLIDL